ncbi:unnamed protein product [Linum tenue]|uniref:Uncharacterized protein n=1 Tax=Linum tenue TaxID=586396 RepID=A0AAV0HJR1_9ROSI|nr:unnamed protein product [Linum tenue]
MGGKGVRRREKNYRAAHGGDSRLPPPPDASNHDAVPSKLRQLMNFASTLHKGPHNLPSPTEDSQGRSKRRKGSGAVEAHQVKTLIQFSFLVRCEKLLWECNLPQVATTSRNEQGNMDSDGVEAGKGKKKSKKRKRNQVKDLRFETLVGNTKTKEKRKERTKKYLEAKKKKKHHRSGTEEETADFPGKENVKFGDVVQAPPKLSVLPKGAKKVIEASQERIRLQAIEAYRKRKAWISRPGLQLPSAAPTTMP